MLRAWLAAVLMLFAIPARAEWHEASTRHFVVYADQGPQKLKAYAAELERFDNVMRMLIAAPNEPVGKANRVTVFVVDDGDDVVSLIRQRNVGGLLRAFELAPFDRSTRFNAAQVLLRDGDKAQARSLLAALAYDPHGGSLAQQATALIAQIDGGDTEGAVKALERTDDDQAGGDDAA